jgi:hypothetical protein
VKAIYRSWAIPCTGKQVYAPRHRCEARKRPAVGDVFFLDFYLYRTNQELARQHGPREPFDLEWLPLSSLPTPYDRRGERYSQRVGTGGCPSTLRHPPPVRRVGWHATTHETGPYMLNFRRSPAMPISPELKRSIEPGSGTVGLPPFPPPLLSPVLGVPYTDHPGSPAPIPSVTT